MSKSKGVNIESMSMAARNLLSSVQKGYLKAKPTGELHSMQAWP